MCIIRPAKPYDVQKIASLINEAYVGYIDRMGKPPAPMLNDYAEVIAHKIVWVLEGSGLELKGVLILACFPDYLLVENIAVHPKHQGMGLGKRLMEFSEAEASRMGYSRMRLYTNVKMVENQAFYEHLGWMKKEKLSEDGYERIYMEKQLC